MQQDIGPKKLGKLDRSDLSEKSMSAVVQPFGLISTTGTNIDTREQACMPPPSYGVGPSKCSKLDTTTPTLAIGSTKDVQQQVLLLLHSQPVPGASY